MLTVYQPLLQTLLYYNSFNSHTTSECMYYAYFHLTDDKTEEHTGQWFKPICSDSKALAPDPFCHLPVVLLQPHSSQRPVSCGFLLGKVT